MAGTMAIPNVSQTFALENCRDMLSKLEWEIDGFRAESRSAPEPLAFRAYNCAVTAWQLTDWTWAAAARTPQLQAALGARSLTDFQNKCRRKCRALHLCRLIATASKHVEVTKYPDP